MNTEYGVLNQENGIATMRLRRSEDLLQLDRIELQSHGISFVIITLDELNIVGAEFKKICEQLNIGKIGLTSTLHQIRIQPSQSARIRRRNFSPEELQQFLERTLDSAAEDRMSFVKSEELAGYKKAIQQHAASGRYLVLQSDEIPVATIVTIEMKIDNKLTELVSWVWSEKNLCRNARIEIQNDFASFLKESDVEHFLASVHLENKRSIKFFQRLGFQPTAVFLNL